MSDDVASPPGTRPGNRSQVRRWQQLCQGHVGSWRHWGPSARLESARLSLEPADGWEYLAGSWCGHLANWTTGRPPFVQCIGTGPLVQCVFLLKKYEKGEGWARITEYVRIQRHNLIEFMSCVCLMRFVLFDSVWIYLVILQMAIWSNA